MSLINPFTLQPLPSLFSLLQSAFQEDPTSSMGRAWDGHAPLTRTAAAIVPTVTGGTAGHSLTLQEEYSVHENPSSV